MRRRYGVSLLLVAATLFVFAQVRHHDFVDYDDDLYVVENPVVQTGLNLKSVVWAFKTTSIANWHPLTWLSHLLDVQLYGLNAGRHHLTSLFIHIANTLLLFLTLRQMTGALWRSAFVAALFALHPLHVESVVQVACRKDVLSTFFWMLAIYTYAGYVHQPGRFRYYLVILFFALGLMAKPMVVTLPFVLLLLDYWPLGRFQVIETDRAVRKNHRFKKNLYLLWEKIPLFILAAASCLITFYVQDKGGAVASLEKYSLGVRFANALVSYTGYITKTIWPANLAFFYPHPGMWPLWEVAGAFCLLLLISILAIRNAKDKPFLIVGWLWYIGTLIPVIGLVQVGAQAMADRYTYVPLIGLFIMISWGADDVFIKRRFRKIVGALSAISIIFVLMAVSWIQTGFWQNSLKLFTHAIEVTSNNTAAHNNLGMVLQEMGRPQEAIPHYQRALQIDPQYAFAHNNWGNALSAMEKHAEAAEHYAAAIKINPQYAKAHYNLANFFMEDGKISEAINHYSESLRIDPSYVAAHNNLGTALARQGRTAEAIAHFQEALRITPDSLAAQTNLKKMLAAQEERDKAVLKIQEALVKNPMNADAHYRLGGLYKSKGDLNAAAAHYQEALAVNPKFFEASKNLGIIYAMQGKYDGARECFHRGITLRPHQWESYYYIAGTYARQNRSAESTDWLLKAVDKGFNDWGLLKNDGNFENIRRTATYQDLMKNH